MPIPKEIKVPIQTHMFLFVFLTFYQLSAISNLDEYEFGWRMDVGWSGKSEFMSVLGIFNTEFGPLLLGERGVGTRPIPIPVLWSALHNCQ
jgi:hypothetical protein